MKKTIKTVYVEHMGCVFSTSDFYLIQWIELMLTDKVYGNVGKRDDEIFEYEIFEPGFKLTRFKPINEKSKTLRKDYYFEQEIYAVKGILEALKQFQNK